MFACHVHGHLHVRGVPISAEICRIHGDDMAYYLAACLMVKSRSMYINRENLNFQLALDLLL